MSAIDRIRAFATSLPTRVRAGWPADRSPVTGAPLRRIDVSLALACFTSGAIATFVASGFLDQHLLGNETMDVWFDADVSRTFEILTNRRSINDRAKFHPLFALIGLPPVYALRALIGLDPWVAVRVTCAAVAGVWTASMYALLRLIGCRRSDAIIFTLLGATSAGAMFWFPIPETHTLAAPTIIFAMVLVAASAHRVIPWLVEVVVSAATLGMTITNWMAGLLASLLRRSLPQTFLISAGAFALVVALWAVQRYVVPRSGFFIGKSVGGSYILSPESRGVSHIAESFFVHSVVMPKITVADRQGAGKWPVMLTQPANPGSAGPWSLVSAVLWCGVFGAGVWALIRLRGRERLRLYLAALLAVQFVLFVLFGNETFLYAPNFLPILIAIAALAALTPARRAVMMTASALVVTNTVGNVAQWRRANAFFDTFAPFYHDFAAAKRARPAGPWPAGGEGRPLEIAPPDTRSYDTGLAMRGGTFSPGLDQFVVSFWVLSDSGKPVAMSDNLAPEQFTSRVEQRADSSVATLAVSTPYYQVRWTPDGVRRYRLDLTIPQGQRLALVVRGVGPMRAPVRQLDWNGERLLINERWSVEPDSRSVAAYLVNENDPAWVGSRPTTRRISVIDGWAAARLELLEPGDHRIILRDVNPSGPMDRVIATIPRTVGSSATWERASADSGSSATPTRPADGTAGVRLATKQR
jgi:hypothetical protein